jgi:hypothetical protein
MAVCISGDGGLDGRGVKGGGVAAEGEGSEAYFSPRELAERWACSRSSVDRIARRAGLSRLCLGWGRNGIVRYLRKEVVAYEQERLVKM